MLLHVLPLEIGPVANPHQDPRHWHLTVQVKKPILWLVPVLLVNQLQVVCLQMLLFQMILQHLTGYNLVILYLKIQPKFLPFKHLILMVIHWHFLLLVLIKVFSHWQDRIYLFLLLLILKHQQIQMLTIFIILFLVSQIQILK